jgi:predicted 2-oxoglutarate/Fe(II)-dependent dioxygenase YbiX
MVEEILAPGINKYSVDSELMGTVYEKVSRLLDPFFEMGRIVTQTGNSYGQAVDTKIRNAQVRAVFDSKNCHPDDEIYTIDASLNSLVQPCMDLYSRYHGLNNIEQTHEWIYMKYQDGGFFNNHKDDGASLPRTVSLIAYLNDNYDGGEIEFPSFNVFLKPKQGDILIFSAAYPYVHNIKKTYNGIRYAAVKWYRYINPQ